ncbi:Uncharacterized protein APZ42_031897 [Daphnia magna]|uniref:Uncharacterized protein n=1 Tax=Daphnia magna TaxID=35525 RepID=A0A164MD24_9CRUS|nr:Uncharacterized protein APZ42_031897 [Daphnia magna]
MSSFLFFFPFCFFLRRNKTKNARWFRHDPAAVSQVPELKPEISVFFFHPIVLLPKNPSFLKNNAEGERNKGTN